MSDVASRPPSEAEEPTRPRPVFIADFAHVGAPYATVAARMLEAEGPWLRKLAKGSPTGKDVESEPLHCSDGAVLFEAVVGPAGHAVSVPVQVRVGPPRHSDQCIVCPVTWTPDVWPALFPELEGDLQLTSLDAEGSAARLGLNCRYSAPMGGVGRAIDKLAMHRVAEATVRKFLLAAADALAGGT